MNALAVAIAVSIAAAAVTIPLVSDQFAGAGPLKKFHFTQTVTSSQDPGQGHGDHQMALILSPSTGTIYDGSLTWSASEPVQVAILHEIAADQSKGQPVWTVDGGTHYALSLLDPHADSGSAEFTGGALALRAPGPGFAATVSVDGWIRGQPTEIISQTAPPKPEDPGLRLSRASVPAEIPLYAGLYDGEQVLYIITDTNDRELSELISEKHGWRVQHAPPLSNATQDALSSVYVFRNGIVDGGIHGYQDEVFSDTPAQPDQYSALRSVVHVEWKIGQNPEVLDSEEAVLETHEAGRIEMEESELVFNMPQIKWPGGQMPVRPNASITDETDFGGPQITGLDEQDMTVTFIAHRGWAADGRTIYHIVAGATPSGPAEKLGAVHAPRLANLIVSPAASDLFEFNNGVPGTGPLGFQPVIAMAAPGDDNYSPLWRVFIVEWNEPSGASVLETKSDIDALSDEELINISLARPFNSDHIVNYPLVDPFWTGQ